jgi:hypothetical protein
MKSLTSCLFLLASVLLWGAPQATALAQTVAPEVKAGEDPEVKPAVRPTPHHSDPAQAVRARLSARAEEHRALQAQLHAAQTMPPASTERGAAIDQVYLSARNLVDRLIEDRNHAIATALQAEVDEASAQLSAARTIRRTAQASASAAISAQVQDRRLMDIQSEITAIPLDAQSAFRRTRAAWWQAPTDVNQVQALGSLFLGLMKLALLLVFSIWLHSRVPIWTRKLMDGIEPGRDGGTWDAGTRFPSWMVAGDLGALAPPLSRVIQDLVTFTTALTVMTWLSEPVPLIAWLALIPAAGAAVRLAKGFIGLAMITPTETRPALRVTDPEAHEALLWIVAVFGTLLAIDVCVGRLLIEILAADQLSVLFSDAIQIVGFILAILGIHRWGDTLRARVVAGGTEGRIAAWIVHPPASKLVGLMSATTAIVLLTGRLIISLAQGLIDNRAGLSWLGAVLARRQLRVDASQPRTPLKPGTRNAIGQGALRELHRDEQLAEISKLYADWIADPRLGLVAVTGDRGTGKATLLDKLDLTLDASTVRAAAPTGHTREARALNWLIRAAGIEASPNTESVVKALMAEPSRVFLLSDLHRLFLRAVGHYEGLDAVLDVMQATGRRHFWVASLHGPAWTFLASMKSVGNVALFPHRVHLGPTSPADMSAWLHARTRAAGFKARFDDLTQQRAQGPNRTRMLERAERAYWRLMVEACQGNPTVAARLWIDGLQPSAKAGELNVGVPRAHDSTELEGLTDGELFGLTAIILHEDISVDELALVLNLAPSRVRGTCRGLEQLTLVTETEAGRYKVRLNWLPAVERHLRRRSFLHKS